MEQPHSPMMAGLPNYSSAHCLFFAKVCRKIYIKCLTGHILHRSSSPTPPYYPPHKTMGGKEGMAWKYKACCVHLLFLRGFSEMLARLMTWEHTHANKNERAQAVPSELDRSRGKGKGKRQGNKS